MARLAMTEWREALAGVTPDQVATGLRADVVRGDAWPPSSAQFRALCFAIPSKTEIAAEIDKYVSATYPNLYSKSRSHGSLSPFARLVWQNMDSYNWRSCDKDEARRMLRDAYELVKTHVMAGGELPEPLIELPPPEPEPERELTPEENERCEQAARECFATLKELLS